MVTQGLVKGAILCLRNPYFYFRHGERTSGASQQSSTASQLSKDLNKVPLILQNLGCVDHIVKNSQQMLPLILYAATKCLLL